MPESMTPMLDVCRQRNLVGLQRRSVEEERVRAIPKTAHHLIHDADRRTDEAVSAR